MFRSASVKTTIYGLVATLMLIGAHIAAQSDDARDDAPERQIVEV